MWRRGIVSGVVAAWLAGVGLACAQPAPSFPASMEREALLLWLQRETDIQADRVVAVTPQALSSVVSTFPAGGGQGPRVVIRAEALNAESVARTGAVSWHVSLNANCNDHTVRLGETTGYPERNLIGERKVLRPAEDGWRRPEPGTALDNAWRSACETDYRGPFRTSVVTMAQVDGAAPPPAESETAPAPAAVPTPAKAAPPRAMQAATAALPETGTVVQVGASPSEDSIKALLDTIAPSAGGRPMWIETARIDGRIWRRALVGGFTDRADATRFCAGLQAAGRACFVRARAAN